MNKYLKAVEQKSSNEDTGSAFVEKQAENLLEKEASTRLGKEIMKKWLAGMKMKPPTAVAQRFENRLVDSLADGAKHPHASGAAHAKFIARTTPTPPSTPFKAFGEKPAQVGGLKNLPQSQRKATSAVHMTHGHPKQPKANNFETPPPVHPKPLAANENSNKYTKRIAFGAAGVVGAGVVGGALYLSKRKKQHTSQFTH